MEEEDEVVNENFNESGEYSSKSEFSKAEVVKAQVTLCSINRSKEMREGYNNYDKYGNKIHIPDSRQEFVNSVIALRTLLKPEILRNEKTFNEKYFIGKEKKLVEKWGIDNGAGEKRIPLLDEPFMLQKKIVKERIYSGQIAAKEIRGMYNTNFHNYWNDMVFLYDEIFAQLNILIDKCDYFKEQILY